MHPEPPMPASLRPLAVAALLIAACEPPSEPAGPETPPAPAAWHPVADLRADVDRDGEVELEGSADEADEEAWTAERGALFLANLDDDGGRCAPAALGADVSDAQLAACHDAWDDIVNGAQDALDLAPLRTVAIPDAPEDAFATVQAVGGGAAYTRLFVRRAGTWRVLAPDARLEAPLLRAGLELALEGRDVVRDPAAWDGSADVVLTLARDAAPGEVLARDRVRLKVAPVLTLSVLQPVEALHVSDPGAAGGADEDAFFTRLEQLREAAGIASPLLRHPGRDRWVQDFFEDAYMAVPAAGGRQHVMRVNVRSAEVYAPGDPLAPLRPAGRVVYALRGPDVAALQQFQLEGATGSRTYNAMGNTETVPPYAGYPLGRHLRGSAAGGAPDASFTRMLEAQGAQPPVYVDTSWLQVGHVDETLALLPSASAPRGWVLLAADPAGARAMFEDLQARGHGEARLFVGKAWRVARQDVPAETTVAQVLARTDVLEATARAATGVEGQLAVLRRELALTDADLVRAPFLFQPHGGKVTAFQPASANLVVLSRTDVAVADPHGPVVDGVDVFKAHLEAQLAPHGLRVHWVDDWNLFHRLAGNVHCGTNATRAVPEQAWWAAAEPS
jgi:protein-arginine deiminase